MKQIEQVSIGGYAFTLDQDALTLAENYLGELGRYYAGSEGGPEILEGIEERMAELLRERCGGGIVGKSTVEAVIAIIGRPEELEEGDSGSQAGMTPFYLLHPHYSHSGLDPESLATRIQHGRVWRVRR